MTIQSLYRIGPSGSVPANGFVTHLDRISAAYNVYLTVYGPLIQTTLTPVNYEVQVDETAAVSSPDSPNPMDVVDHFRPGKAGSTPTVFPMGIFGTDTDAFAIPVGFDFGSSTDTSTGIISGGSISIYAESRGTVWATGYYHVGPNGTLSTYYLYNYLVQR